jgi:transcriptional regulator with XRE-family HTH domain
MPSQEKLKTIPIAENLAAIRAERGLSQEELARRARLRREQINYFETGARVPRLGHLLKIAQALDVPLQRFLSGSNNPGTDLPQIIIELRSLGLIDLWTAEAEVPGAFRRPEEVLALAVSGHEPPARIVEGVPALLAWNRVSNHLLWAFARDNGRATIYRLAWLADIALALDRMGGFPGGCPGKEPLQAFVKRIKIPATTRWDSLGRAADKPPTSPLWKRWRISYQADLATFRTRAEGMVALAKAEGIKLLGSDS